MKLVTYGAERGPRVGGLDGEHVADAGFDGDMVALIEAGAPIDKAMPATVIGPDTETPWHGMARARRSDVGDGIGVLRNTIG